MQQVPKWYKRSHASHFPVLVGANIKPRVGIFLFPCVSFALSKWPRAAGQRGVQAGGAGAAGTRQPSRNGGELSSTAPGRQCQRPRCAPGGRPIGGARPAGALSRPLSRGRAEPPGGPHSPQLGVSLGDQTPWALQSSGRRPPRGQGHPTAHGTGSPARPARNLGASARWAQAGGADDPGHPPHPTEPAPAPRNSPGPGGPLGIIPSPARRQLPGGGADARAAAPQSGDRGSRSGARGAAGSGGRGARGAGRAARALSARPRRRRRPGEAREASAAQEGAGDHVPRGGGRSDARGSHDPARRRRARVSGNPNTSTGNRNPD
ncbi:translation initiation factor IF-2-like [Pteropus medius]|uniref:translation initiation factor IF-2-like n=1 Tax=Pteropus vampyrus TaxID=132908 RepID=UPI00196A793B|nr:translation initiation factor IF-2-like [Pteropus giganteus]XP_039701811.1 translation initiation factor IF-2-like [Pteropus giganteus]